MSRILLLVLVPLVALQTACFSRRGVELANRFHSSGIETGAINQPVDYSDPLLIEHRTILLTTEINEQTSHSIISKLLFLNHRSHEPITLYLSTYGGYIKDAFAIIDVIEAIDAPVNTVGMGACYSGGALILAAGTGVRSALPNTTIVIHSPTPQGRAPKKLTDLWLHNNSDLLNRRTRLPKKLLPHRVDHRIILSLDDALRHGMIDRIAETL